MPVCIRLNTAILIGRSWKAIVNEGHVVPDKNIVFDVHTLANEAMAGNLAILTDCRTLLDLHKSTNLAAIVDAAAVCVHEIENLDILPNFHVVKRLFIGVDGERFHDSD